MPANRDTSLPISAAGCSPNIRQRPDPTRDLLFLQNHGVFFAADSTEDIDALVTDVMGKLNSVIYGWKEYLGGQLSALLGTGHREYVSSPEIAAFDPSFRSPTPDHIVYCKAKYLVIDMNITAEALKSAVENFASDNGYNPRVVIVRGRGAFVFGTDAKQLDTVKNVFLDHVKVYSNSEFFGGYSGMSEELVDFIVNWEVESYRAKVSGN